MPRISSRFVPWVAGLFWLGFYLSYPYRLLIDDTRFESILKNQYFYFETIPSRPIHSALLYLQGLLFGSSMEKAMVLGILLHLCAGFLLLTKWVPRLPEGQRRPAMWGTLAFLVHPASMQTAVHVAQRGEILGGLFAVLSLIVLQSALERKPSARDAAKLGALALAAVLSKEPYILVPLAAFAILALRGALPRPRAVAAALAALVIGGALLSPFSRSDVQNESFYSRSRAFRQAASESRINPPETSIILPIRTRAENLPLQLSLVPRLAQITFLPFGLVKDYGHFPWGKETYSASLPWLWIGLLAVMLLILGLVALARRHGLEDAILVGLPAFFYSVYWIFPVHDPLVLYRLYGVALLTFTVSLPTLMRRSPRAEAIMAALALICLAGGVARAHELASPLREAKLELERAPENYRNAVDQLHRLIEAGAKPDCRSILEPALPLAPSAALIYVDWAWCLTEEGRESEAEEMARKSLEYESVPENIQVALSYLTRKGSVSFDLSRIHPSNRAFMFRRN